MYARIAAGALRAPGRLTLKCSQLIERSLARGIGQIQSKVRGGKQAYLDLQETNRRSYIKETNNCK
jgi:hypothetical protein